MAKITFPADGGTICLDVVLKQDYQCTDGSSGTTVCSVYGSQYDKCPDITISSNFYPYTGFSSDLVYIDNDGCIHCDYNNDDDEETEIGEFCLETTINGKTTEECVEITVEPKGCTYGPVNIELSFPEMSPNGGYSSRVCATYSFSQTVICDGVEGVITSCDDDLCEEWSFTTPYGEGETSITHENGTVCLIGPENTSTEERVVSTVTLKVTLNNMEGVASFDVIQSGVTQCTYGPVSVNLFFPEMSANGGYSSRVCADYSFSQTVICDGVEEIITSCDGGECEYWTFTDPYGKEETSLSYENDTVCLVGPENTSEDERIVSTVTLTVTLNGIKGEASFDVVQYGTGGCVYEDIDVSDFTYSHISSAPFSVCGGSISPISTCFQYRTCNGVRSCNGDLQVSYSWVERNVSTAELDPETGTVTCNDSNMTNTATRTIGTIRVTANDGTNEKSTETVLVQAAGDGNVYDNPCIEALSGTSVPAEGGSLDLSTRYHYWQNYNCDNPGSVDCVDSGSGPGCQQCPSADPYVNCGSATITYEVLKTYDDIEVSLSDDGILTTEHVNGTDNNIKVADIKVTVSWHCLESDLDFTVYQASGTTTCEYEKPVINLEYDTYTIPYQGGEFCPTFSYNQHWSCTDDTSGDISEGAEVKWTADTTIPSAFQVYDNGCIYVDSAEVGRDLGTVTVTVTLNGETNSKTVAFTQAGEVTGEWNYPQVSVNYANIPKDGGSTRLTLNVTSYKYDESGNVVDTRTLSYVDGVKTYDDYGDDMTEFYIDMTDEISGTVFNEETYEITQNGANTAAASRLVCYIDCYVVAFNKAGEEVFQVYQDGETETYIADNDVSSQYTALIGTIVNRNLAEIQVYADRYEDGQVQETGVLIAQFGYESNKILSKGDVFYGHFIDGIHCGEWHINKLGLRGYKEQGYPQYFPKPYELRIDNNYLGKLDEPDEIEGYSTEIPPIYIYNSGSTPTLQATNCELHFYHISYSQ